MVVDCDVHHGNGTADIFSGDPSVYTISLHQANNYPTTKPRSDIDIHLPDGVGDEEYNARLNAALMRALPGSQYSEAESPATVQFVGKFARQSGKHLLSR